MPFSPHFHDIFMTRSRSNISNINIWPDFHDNTWFGPCIRRKKLPRPPLYGPLVNISVKSLQILISLFLEPKSWFSTELTVVCIKISVRVTVSRLNFVCSSLKSRSRESEICDFHDISYHCCLICIQFSPRT